MTEIPELFTVGRYEIRHGKFGAYFHDNEGGSASSMTLVSVLQKLNESVELKARLRAANKRRRSGTEY